MPEPHIPNNNNVLLDKGTAMLFPVGKEQNMILVQASGLSHVGKVRKANEDNFLINKPLNLFIVADGMGGHRGGGVASRIAVKVINAYLAAKLADRSDSETADTADNPSHASMRLHQSITLANQKIHERSAADETCRGMGTTVSALFISGDTLVTANVTTRVFQYRRDMEQLLEADTPFHRHLYRWGKPWVVWSEKERRLPGAHMHDPLTVSILIHPDFCQLKEMRVDVRCLLAGTSGWLRSESGDITVRAAVDVDVTRFESFLAERLASQILSKYRHL